MVDELAGTYAFEAKARNGGRGAVEKDAASTAVTSSCPHSTAPGIPCLIPLYPQAKNRTPLSSILKAGLHCFSPCPFLQPVLALQVELRLSHGE